MGKTAIPVFEGATVFLNSFSVVPLKDVDERKGTGMEAHGQAMFTELAEKMGPRALLGDTVGHEDGRIEVPG